MPENTDIPVKRIVLIIVVALVFYALVDIMIWQRIFETNGMFDYNPQYSRGFHLVLYGEAAVGALFLYPGWKNIVLFVSSLLLFGFNGTEDILYYVLDGRSVPATLPWLTNALMLIKPVTGTGLVLNVILWLIIWSVILVIIWDVQTKFKNWSA